MTYYRRDVSEASVHRTPAGQPCWNDRNEVVEGVLVARVCFVPERAYLYGIQLDSGEVILGFLRPSDPLVNDRETTHTPSQWDGRRNGEFEIVPV